MQLYDVTFTSTKPIRRYDKAGNCIGESSMETPIEMTGLTEAQAKAYEGNPDFEMLPHQRDRHIQKSISDRSWAGSATKKVITNLKPVEDGVKKGELKLINSGTGGRSEIAKAARTGDMGAAING
jgi:hypothetical protein